MPDDGAAVLDEDKGLAANPITGRLSAISTRSLGGLAIFIVVSIDGISSIRSDRR